MKRIFVLFVVLGLVAACVPQTKVTVQPPATTVEQAVTYEGPRARIAVARFEPKAAKSSWEMGDGLSDMLATSLFRTGRFIVLERGEGLEEVKKELELGQSGYVKPEKAPQIGLFEGADILLIGAITAFEPKASGVGGGGNLFVFPGGGSVDLGKKDAYIASDIRLVDVRTGRVVNATRVDGRASSWNVGLRGTASDIAGSVVLRGGLGVYKNTPMEKAIMVMLDNAIKAIAQMVPESYYRHGKPAPVPAVAPATVTPSEPAPKPQAPLYVAFPSTKDLRVTGSKVNVRDGPGTNYPVITVVRAGQMLKGIGKEGKWYNVRLPDEEMGWISSRYVAEE